VPLDARVKTPFPTVSAILTIIRRRVWSAGGWGFGAEPLILSEQAIASMARPGPYFYENAWPAFLFQMER